MALPLWTSVLVSSSSEILTFRCKAAPPTPPSPCPGRGFVREDYILWNVSVLCLLRLGAVGIECWNVAQRVCVGNAFLQSARIPSVPIPVGINVYTGHQHGVDMASQTVVFQGCGNPLFVSQLLGDAFILCVCAFFQFHIQSVVRWQACFKTGTHSQTDNSSQTAVVDRRSEVNSHCRQGLQVRSRTRLRWRVDMDIWKVDHRELAKSKRVLWIGNGGNQIWTVC